MKYFDNNNYIIRYYNKMEFLLDNTIQFLSIYFLIIFLKYLTSFILQKSCI